MKLADLTGADELDCSRAYEQNMSKFRTGKHVGMFLVTAQTLNNRQTEVLHARSLMYSNYFCTSLEYVALNLMSKYSRLPTGGYF